MVLKVAVIPKVNGKSLLFLLLLLFLLIGILSEKLQKFVYCYVLFSARLQEGYPLPAIGKMQLVNSQLQVLKVSL